MTSRSSQNSTEMKATQVLLLVFGCFFVAVTLGQKKLYSTKYDNVDMEAVIKNERLLKNYVGCLLDRNPCTADASEMKKNLPDALATNCGGCSEAQKRLSDRLAHHLIDNKPQDWSLLEDKYDPTGDYRQRYLHERENNHAEVTTSSTKNH